MIDVELLDVLSNWKEELINHMDSIYTELKSNMETMRIELKEDMETLRTELKGDINTLRTELKGDIDALRTELKAEMNSMYIELKGDINSLNDRLQALENICTIIQKEHGEKLELLLDYASANIEKHEEYDKKIEHFENKLFDHDVRLGIIESSSWYKKMLKGKENSNFTSPSLP